MASFITTLLLDADGVVQTSSPGWLESLTDLCGKTDSAEAFLEDVFAAERPTLTGRGSFRPALAEVLARWESAATVDEAIRLWQLIEPQTAVLEQARRLRDRGVRVCLATNQQPERAAFMTDSLGYRDHFDALFYSCELGYAKPSPDYFAAVLARLNQPAGEVLFVDDHATNVRAAEAVGLQARVYDLSTGSQGMIEILAEFGLHDG